MFVLYFAHVVNRFIMIIKFFIAVLMGARAKRLGNRGQVMRADVVILNYNNGHLIKDCICSLEKFKTDCRVIVVDQGSSDGTCEWLKSNKFIDKLILNDKNTGAWEGRNQGLRCAQTDRIVFFDSDTQVRDAEWLDQLLSTAEEKLAGIIEAKVELYDRSIQFAGFAACMIKREVFDEIGRFDPNFLIGGDNDFWARFIWCGKWAIRFCDLTNIYHYCGGTIVRGVLKDQAKELHQKYRIDLLEKKYTKKFLRDTQWKLNNLRFYHEQKRGWRDGK